MPSFSSTRSFIRDTCAVSVTSAFSIHCTTRRGVGRDRGRVPGSGEKRNPPCSRARCRVQSPCPSGCALCFACQLGILSPDTHVLGPAYSLDLHGGRCVCGLCGEVVGVGAVVVGESVLGVVCSGGRRRLRGPSWWGRGARQRRAGQGEEGAQPPLPRRCLPVLWRCCGAGGLPGDRDQKRERERKHISDSKPLSSVYRPSETFVVYPEPRYSCRRLESALARSLAPHCTVVVDCGIITRPHPLRRHGGGAEPHH
jgi:hypothetical protein